MSFGTWEKTDCDRCGCEFQVTRTEPKVVKGDVVCGDCEMYERGYKDGLKDGKDNDEMIELFECDLFALVNDYAKKGVSKPNLVRKLKWVLGSTEVS